LELNRNESTTYKNIWDIAKAVLRGELIAIKAYTKNTEISPINDPMLHPKFLEKQEQAKCKISRKGEITIIKAKISEIVTKKPNK
jgi:hypothetical protein